jgi:hypothetical protein
MMTQRKNAGSHELDIISERFSLLYRKPEESKDAKMANMADKPSTMRKKSIMVKMSRTTSIRFGKMLKLKGF